MLLFEIIATLFITVWVTIGISSTILLFLYDMIKTDATYKDYMTIATMHLCTGGFYTFGHVFYCFTMDESEYCIRNGYISLLK